MAARIFTSGFWKEARSQAIGIVLGLMVPGTLTGVTVFFSHVQNFPVPVTIVFGSIVFFFSMGALIMVRMNTMMTGAEHRLRYVNTMIPMDFQPDKRAAQAQVTKPGAQRHLDKIQLGVMLQNTANFPISAYLEFAETEMEGNKPPRDTFPKPPVTIVPGNTVFMVDAPIPMNNAPCKNMDGRLDIRVRYGRKGNEKFVLEFKGKVQLFMLPTGLVQNYYTNWDSNQI